MDFGDIIKRAWRVTWHHKALWVLGLFAGASGSGVGGWGGSGRRFDSDSLRSLGARGEDLASTASAHLSEWAPVLAAALVLLALLGVFFVVVSFAAQAGLAFEVDEAESRRPVSLSTGWNVGFHYWWRVLVVNVLLVLPLVAVAIVVTIIVAVAVLTARFGEGAGAAGLLYGFIGMGVLLVPVFVLLAFAVGVLHPLAVRYIAIEGRGATEALAAAWRMLRHRLRDVFLMWLVVVVLGAGFGFALVIPAGAVGFGVFVAFWLGVWPVAALLGMVLVALVIFLGAGWNTFTSALWTVFFRKLTGREMAAVHVPPGYAPPVPQAGLTPGTGPS